MNTKEAINQCPICHGPLKVTRLTCHKCNVEITGEFKSSRFAGLSKNELDFVEAFIRVQGNIKEMERLFDVSYPTIKKQLEGIIDQLGGGLGKNNTSAETREISQDEILEKIKNKEISVDEALVLLKK